LSQKLSTFRCPNNTTLKSMSLTWLYGRKSWWSFATLVYGSTCRPNIC
jgi:hypothetical protein